VMVMGRVEMVMGRVEIVRVMGGGGDGACVPYLMTCWRNRCGILLGPLPSTSEFDSHVLMETPR